jgi:cell division protein ZapE
MLLAPFLHEVYIESVGFNFLLIRNLLIFPVNAPDSPLTRYQHSIKQGILRSDQAQLQAIRRLDSLYNRLISMPPQSSWIQRFRKPSAGTLTGFYLWGGVGTGKTVLMDIFHRCLPAGLAQRIHFHRFMQSVHERKNEIRDQQDPLGIVAVDFASELWVLCLDEFSVTDITDAMILYGLLDHLFQRGVVLVTTSNTRIDDLYRDGLQRTRFLPAIDLLKKHTDEIHIDGGSDYRMEYLQDDAIFHCPSGKNADAELAKCFERLAGKIDENITTISISGRNIDVVAAGPGVAWFDFQSLCQTIRSKSDYIEIARQYHTVQISNIPQMDAAMDDACRRFIELVDELYDRNVNLIVSSATQPEMLYVGTRLAEPFLRTASRLNEMRSRTYLSKPHLP